MDDSRANGVADCGADGMTVIQPYEGALTPQSVARTVEHQARAAEPLPVMLGSERVGSFRLSLRAEGLAYTYTFEDTQAGQEALTLWRDRALAPTLDASVRSVGADGQTLPEVAIRGMVLHPAGFDPPATTAPAEPERTPPKTRAEVRAFIAGLDRIIEQNG